MVKIEAEFAGPDGVATLVSFHDDVRNVLSAFEKEFASAQTPHRLAAAGELLLFIRGPMFDHEEAEDNLLKPAMERNSGSEHSKVINGLKLSHERIAQLRLAAANAIEAFVASKGAARDTSDALKPFLDGTRKHLAAEEQMVYPLAAQLLGEIDRRDLHWQLEKLYQVSQYSQQLRDTKAPRKAAAAPKPKAKKTAKTAPKAKVVKASTRAKPAAARPAPKKKRAARSRA